MKNSQNNRLAELTTTLRDQQWVEFEFNKFQFHQFCDALLGREVQLVTGNKAWSISISEFEEMDALTTEFSLLFCKSELRKTISLMNENESNDQRLLATTSTADLLRARRNLLNSNIFFLEN